MIYGLICWGKQRLKTNIYIEGGLPERGRYGQFADLGRGGEAWQKKGGGVVFEGGGGRLIP